MPSIWPKAPLYIMLFFTLAYVASEDTRQIRICDSNVNWNPPPIYTDFIKSLYEQGFSGTPLVQRDDCFQYDDVNKGLDIGIIASVFVATAGAGASIAIAGAAAGGGLIASKIIKEDNTDYNTGIVDINNRRAECRAIQTNIRNYFKGISLVVKWPISYLIQSLLNTNSIAPVVYEQYTEQILTLKYNTYDSAQLHDFVTKSSQSTVWTAVTFDVPTMYSNDLPPYCTYDMNSNVLGGSKKCIHPFFKIGNQFFKTQLSFTNTGFKDYADYIHFDKKLYTGINKKLIQVKDIEGNLKWGVLMPGCTPPTFLVRVVWEENNKMQCNRPTITVTDIVGTENFICKKGFTTNTL